MRCREALLLTAAGGLAGADSLALIPGAFSSLRIGAAVRLMMRRRLLREGESIAVGVVGFCYYLS